MSVDEYRAIFARAELAHKRFTESLPRFTDAERAEASKRDPEAIARYVESAKAAHDRFTRSISPG